MAITQLTKTEFSEKIANLDSAISEWHYLGSRPAIVDFYATWCGLCRTLAPILEELSEEYAGEVDIYKVDIDREQELAAAFGVRSVPTLLRPGNAADGYRGIAEGDAARSHRRAAAQTPRRRVLIPQRNDNEGASLM